MTEGFDRLLHELNMLQITRLSDEDLELLKVNLNELLVKIKLMEEK